jgi:hypothetical protein
MWIDVEFPVIAAGGQAVFPVLEHAAAHVALGRLAGASDDFKDVKSFVGNGWVGGNGWGGRLRRLDRRRRWSGRVCVGRRGKGRKFDVGNEERQRNQQNGPDEFHLGSNDACPGRIINRVEAARPRLAWPQFGT